MPQRALTFDVRPGSEAQVAALLADYPAPSLEIDADTRLLGTAVFMKGTFVVRYVEFEGEFSSVARHLAGDPAIREIERRLEPHLAQPRNMADPESARRFFVRALMQQLTHRTAPRDATPA